ncbi:MAG: bioD [Caulobacter sp.]|nr:bioD [Caulobacter sp.]
MAALFVTGAGTDIGKTHVACALITALRARGMAVDAFKPVLSGFDPNDLASSDAGRLAAALGRPEAWAAIAPRRFRAPLSPPTAAALEGETLALDDLVADGRARMGAADGLLLIEGAGGVMSPLTETATNLDLMAALRAPVLLVVGSYLGALSHALTALVALRARGLTVAAVVMSESQNAPDLDQTGASLKAFETEAPVFLAPRGAAWTADALADLILA